MVFLFQLTEKCSQPCLRKWTVLALVQPSATSASVSPEGRFGISRDNHSIFKAHPERFLQQSITMDEPQVHHLKPETEQSKQWKHPESPAPKKATSLRSAGRVMASVVWDAK